jgi:hypothetical protein
MCPRMHAPLLLLICLLPPSCVLSCMAIPAGVGEPAACGPFLTMVLHAPAAHNSDVANTFLTMQVWVSLLRVTQPEPKRGLMREVLDTLIPTLVDKLGTRSPDGKIAWVRCGLGMVTFGICSTCLHKCCTCSCLILFSAVFEQQKGWRGRGGTTSTHTHTHTGRQAGRTIT